MDTLPLYQLETSGSPDGGDDTFSPQRSLCNFNTGEAAEVQQHKGPSQCLDNCRSQYAEKVASGWEATGNYRQLCQALTGSEPNLDLWPLYWCDATFCGVGIDPQASKLNQDPNVDFLINTCQNHGFYSILDPGPPPLGYNCTAIVEEARPPAPESFSISTSHGGRQLPTPSPGQTEAQTAPATTSANHSAETVSASPAQDITSDEIGAPNPTSSHHHDPSVTASTTPSLSTSNSASSSNLPTASEETHVSSGAKAIISVCSVLGLAALVCVVLFSIRRCQRCRDERRRGRPRADAMGRRRLKSHGHHMYLAREFAGGGKTATGMGTGKGAGTETGSPTPLIWPPTNPYLNHHQHRHSRSEETVRRGVDDVPLTPPLRLCARRFLPAGRQDGDGSMAGSPTLMPVQSRGAKRLDSRKEFEAHKGDAPAKVGAASTTSLGRDAASLYLTPPSPLSEVSDARKIPTPPGSPLRPPRPHEEPLEIPDLVSPYSRSSPVSSTATLSRPSGIGPPPNRALPPPPPLTHARAAPPPAGVEIVTAPSSSRAHSWGSWSGVEVLSSVKFHHPLQGSVGAKAPAGLAFAPGHGYPRGPDSPAVSVLQEEDLKSLGVRY